MIGDKQALSWAGQVLSSAVTVASNVVDPPSARMRVVPGGFATATGRPRSPSESVCTQPK